MAAFAHVLTHTGMLKIIQEQVRFARARFGTYDLVDFVAVLIGYAVSGESTLLAFYERLAPFAEPFMALFGRNLLPHRSTLSRFLAALDQTAVEALRTCFQKDLSVEQGRPCSCLSQDFRKACPLCLSHLCILLQNGTLALMGISETHTS